MKSQSVASSVSETQNFPSGDAIILFDFDNQPKLGTRSIRPGGTVIFTTPQFPIAEPLTIIGRTPFVDDNAFTNTPIRIIDHIEPKDNPYKFTVVYQGYSQQVFLRMKSGGVDAAELRWATAGSAGQWRASLRLPGAVQKVRLLKELLPSSPFFNYEFRVFNEATRQPVPVVNTPFGQEVTVDNGFYTTIAVPPAHEDDSRTPMEVGGTDAADLIISPGG